MAHYAFINSENIVVEVITGKDETEGDWEKEYEFHRNGLRCLRTSYNTREGVHVAGGVPFRKNYAGIGCFYDEVRDAFIPPKRYMSWVFNEEKCVYEPPFPRPNDGKVYEWDESVQNWVIDTYYENN